MSRKVLIWTSRANGDQRIKVTINWNFEANILTSKYRIHKVFWKKFFRQKKNFEPKLLWFLFLIFLPPVLHDIQIWLFLDQFDDDVATRDYNFKILRKKFHKQIPHLKVPFNFNFHLSMTISIWDTSLGTFSSQFWVDDVTTRVKTVMISWTFVVLLVWNKGSSFVPNFVMIDWKLGLI